MSPGRELRLVLAALLLLAPLGAAADLLSPGPLAREHEQLEGIRNCTKCHEAGEQLVNAKCAACHGEVERRMSRGEGFHGRLPETERSCATCHGDHHGRDFQLIDWGASGKERFDHGRSGWPLTGKHRTVKCAGCHDRRLIADPDIKKLLREGPRKETYLGAPTACAACHFDEHRGQLSDKCEKCHGTEKWKPPATFDHGKTEYPLLGRHREVKCEKCHEQRGDDKTPAGAFPAPRAATFLLLKEIPHQACTDCHKDPHAGRFGSRCQSCHSEAGWLVLHGAAKDPGFHEKTRYPLRGEHVSVPCVGCHGPFPGQRAKFKGLPFQSCGACHPDAHFGQLRGAGPRAQPPDCEACHKVEGFRPPRYEAADHQRTSYPLDGAHQAVPCSACHAQDRSLVKKLPEAVKRDLKRKKQGEHVSLAVLDLPKAKEGCKGCHSDEHRGQFKERLAQDGCEGCHRSVASFHEVTFDHDQESRFPLEGAHRKARCASCHQREHAGQAELTRYKPLETRCAGCHEDVHAGQLAQQGVTDCTRCHGVEAFRPAPRFRHEPPFTQFLLDGAHARVECKRCHTVLEVAPGVKAARYVPLPTTCEGCHADFHQGAFQGFEASHAGGETRCIHCHQTSSWHEVTFAHDRTGFPLVGSHEGVSCRACHQAEFTAPVPRVCAGCHRDVHRGELGQRCDGCHDERSWDSAMTADAHRRTAFPLSGRHAFLPCAECHPGAPAVSFVGNTVPCLGCHASDYARAGNVSLDHTAFGFSTDCRSCHDAWTFARGRYPAHDACFQLSGGPHSGIACLDCHTTLRGASGGGSCSTNTASCTGCHEHQCGEVDSEHRGVPGYQCRDRKCYECHRFSTGSSPLRGVRR